MDYSLLGIEPVPGDQPTGNDVRYENEFDQLQMEIDKLASPTDRESFSWARVVDLGSHILKEKSKDILVASYLCVGLIHLHKGDGLDLASKIYDDLIETFWDNLFPLKKRMQGRIAAIEWWIEKTESALDNGFSLTSEPDVLEKIIERFNRIEAFLKNNPEFKLSVNSIANKIKIAATQALGKENQTKKNKTEQADRLNGITDTIDIKIRNAEDARKSLTPLFQKIRQASKLVREDKTHNPQSYRWLRFALWETIKNIPFANDGLTKLSPPSRQMIDCLENLKNEEEWEELLSGAESALNNPPNIFLLDLNWYSAEALNKLGRKYKAAHEIVCHETFVFTNRLTGVEDLAFSDGTPFASKDTKEWLRQLKSPDSQETENDLVMLLSDENSSVATAINEAKNLLKCNIFDAVNYLQDKINNSFSKKQALLLRLGLVKLLISSKNEKIAIPHLDLILNDILKFSLDVWEPELALNGLKNVYTIFKKQSDNKYKQKAEEVFNMIANISTVAAMKL